MRGPHGNRKNIQDKITLQETFEAEDKLFVLPSKVNEEEHPPDECPHEGANEHFLACLPAG